MYFALDEAQRQLQDTVRTFAATHSTEQIVRARMADASAHDPAGWTELVTGVAATLGSGSPEVGRGSTLVDCAAVLEVLGESLYVGPYLSSAVAAQLLAFVAEDDPAAGLPAGIAAGSALVCVVWSRDSDGVAVSEDGSTDQHDDTVLLNGTFDAVLDGDTAHTLLVVSDHGCFEVADDAAGLNRHALVAFDQTRRLASVGFTGTRARRVRLTIPDKELVDRLTTIERVLVAADNVGVARHALRASIDYASSRRQFGRPIGSFQALQHLLADLALTVEGAWAATFEAAWAVDEASATAARSAAHAAALSGEAALAAAELMLQIHGGVGFMWDNPSHLYLKRAKSNRLLWGHPDAHRRRLAELLAL